MNINEIWNKIDDNYNIIEIRDCYDDDTIFIAFLNKKHSIEEFQGAINKAKIKRQEDIQKYGDDWTWIEEELEDFDYMTVSFDDARYYVEY